MAYSRVTREERNHIHRWRQEGCGVREIAALLSRAASSISRELSRNTGLRGYRPKQARRLAVERGGARAPVEAAGPAARVRRERAWPSALARVVAGCALAADACRGSGRMPERAAVKSGDVCGARPRAPAPVPA